METIKKTTEYEIIKKRSGRYGVRDAQQNWITGNEKVKILLAEKLIKAPAPKEEPEPEAAEASADVAAEEAPEETSAEEAPAEPAAEKEASE